MNMNDYAFDDLVSTLIKYVLCQFIS